MSNKKRTWCGSAEHLVSRRTFLSAAAVGAVAADMTLLNVLKQPAFAEELKRQDKRVILLWLAGAASQLETWDPKPGHENGGPFAAIPTVVPGVHISELMPKMARRVDQTAIIRSLNTKDGSHGSGAKMMHLGRRDDPNVTFPDLGAIVAREMGRLDSQVPDYVSFYTATEGRGNAVGQSGFLGARYAPMFLTTETKPANLGRLEAISDLDHQQRGELRALLSNRFAVGRKSDTLASHNEAYARVRGLMSSEKLFDISDEPQKQRDMYGPTLFGEQVLVARRLIEAGTPFVKVSRAWWDSHGQNFETHLELVTELDHVMSGLVDDLKSRGLLENTLIITVAEFGRTPRINASLGRDHFASAWSASLTGCGMKGGAVYGQSSDDGNTVKDGEIGAPELFATIFQALGIDHQKEYYLGSRPVPLTNPGTQPVNEILA